VHVQVLAGRGRTRTEPHQRPVYIEDSERISVTIYRAKGFYIFLKAVSSEHRYVPSEDGTENMRAEPTAAVLRESVCMRKVEPWDLFNLVALSLENAVVER